MYWRTRMKLLLYIRETRPQFLVLSCILIFLALGMSYYYETMNWVYLILCLFGLVLLHISVNTINDYCDYRSGIDLQTNRTPFSGGSGLLTAGIISPGEALALGLGSFALAAPIGLFFLFVRGVYLLPLFLAGAGLVLLYTVWLTRIGYGIPEIAAGMGLGTLPVFGTFYIVTGQFDTGALFASIPSGILVGNLLFLNEFPDTAADATAGRKTLPIIMGVPAAARLYAATTILVYIWIVLGCLAQVMPLWTLLGLLTFPLAWKAITITVNNPRLPAIIPALATNVQVVLGTQLLMGLGFIIAHHG